MRALNDFKLNNLPLWKVVFAATSEPDYEMSRILFVEDWPGNHEYTVVEGYHCSCYNFDDSDWEATVYTLPEVVKLLASWLDQDKRYCGAEHLLAPMALNYLAEEGPSYKILVDQAILSGDLNAQNRD